MKRNTAVLSAVLASAFLLAPALSVAQVYVVPAPGPRYERMPPPRHGAVWHPGYWRWAHGAYVWAPGVWVPVVAQPYGYQQVVVTQAPVQPLPPPPPPRVER